MEVKRSKISMDGEEGAHLSWDLMIGFGFRDGGDLRVLLPKQVNKTEATTVKQKVFTGKAYEIKHDRNEFMIQT